MSPAQTAGVNAEEIRRLNMEWERAFLLQCLLQIPWGPLDLCSRRTKDASIPRGTNIYVRLLQNTRNWKLMAKTILTTVMSAKLPPPSWLPYIFSSPVHHQHHQAGLPKWSTLGRHGSPLGPQMLPFPFHGHFNIFSEEREPGSNMRAKHKRIQRPGCLFLGQ